MRALLTNLLPPERQRAITRGYRLRLIVVIVWFVSALAFIAIILLIPTFILVMESARAKEQTLASLESSLSSAEEKEFSARLAALQDAATTLADMAKHPSVSGILRAVLAVPRPGITLSHFSYTPASAKEPAALAIAGVAGTREALRTYQLALESASFAKAAALPVSAYAKDKDITFAITITLAP